MAGQDRQGRRRVAKALIANDETEISEVIRRRLFQDLGPRRRRSNVAKAFADWCFERRAQLPPEWTAVDTSTTEKKAREFLQARFEACYPFHPATLSVFQRKWQSLPQYQQTRGTLAMLAQWISKAVEDGYSQARTEPLITLGSAPLDVPGFRSVVLGQLGESRLLAAIDTDIAGEQSHARALDADTTGVAAGHPPARRNGDPVRVVRRADRQGRAPARTAVRARRAGTGHDLDGQRCGRAGGQGVLHPAGGRGRLQGLPQGQDREGGARPAGVARRRGRDQAHDAQAWSRTSSDAARAFPSSRSRPTAARCRTRRG